MLTVEGEHTGEGSVIARTGVAFTVTLTVDGKLTQLFSVIVNVYVPLLTVVAEDMVGSSTFEV
jgi:hypothetical protein